LKKLVALLLIAAVAALVLASVAFAKAGVEKAEFQADLASLNGSGASGEAELKLENGLLEAEIESEGLAPGLGHLQHIHGFAQAVSECPTLAADANGDGLVDAGEGGPSYGPILVSFTATGDTSPASAGALDRFPVADSEGEFEYERTFGIPANVGARLGDFAVVQHGVDLNGNGMYDSPFEVALPATCGVIEPK
jgi:hypothetical protein